MKEKMRKISLLVFYKERAEIINKLQELGVLHLETEEVVNEQVEQINEQKTKFQKAIDIIKQHLREEEIGTPAKSVENIENERDNILKLQEEINHSDSQIENIKKEINLLQPWGDFSWGKIDGLQEHDLNFRFYAVSKKEYQKFDFKDIYQFIISQVKSTIYFCIIEKEPIEQELPFQEIKLPHHSISELQEKIKDHQQQIEAAEQKIIDKKSLIPQFEEEVLKIEDQLHNVIANQSFKPFAEGKILHIKGWLPVNIEPQIKDFSDQNDLSYIIEEPTKDDQIPVILKNKPLPKRFEPITKIFQLPNYYEYDLTPVIAVFYPIFFAYCLGDSGYGFVILIAALIGRFTFFKNSKIIADLGIILGIIAGVLGIIKAGTFFGIPIVEHQDVPLFAFLSQYMLIPDNPDVVFNTFNVALMVGLFQIIVGVFIAIFRKIKYQSFIYAVATIGKLFIILGAVTLFLGGMQGMALFVPYVTLGWISMLGGMALVLLFHDPDTPILPRIGGGVLPIYFIFTGLLGDTLSYIRLFAIGVASSILGLVVNQIGNQIMAGGVISLIIGIVFLIFGHTLNLALASLGSFVHPLRLTFVEFYNNAEFKGGGVEYKPFKKQILSNKT